MNWNSLFNKEQTISPDDARQWILSDKLKTSQLLDVRQPKEYEQSHLPGALLIPLPELADNLSTLNKNDPVIVYCRSGVRSKSACQILIQAGFTDCYNMAGGILKWSGAEAAGDEQFGLDYFVHGDFSSSFAMAYQMEAHLQMFYLLLSEDSDNSAEKKMLQQMAQLEVGHMAKLQKKYNDQFTPAKTSGTDAGVMEGGIDPAVMRSALPDQLGSAENVLELAMKLEAQALDLYNRLARTHHGSDVALFFVDMAVEEQSHLRHLSKQLDKLLEN